MPIPTQSDVHVNQPLTNLTEAFRQDQTKYIAETIFPPLPVENKSDVFYRWSLADFIRAAMQQRAPGAIVEMGGVRLAQGNYTCNEWALGYPIPDSIRRNADKMLNLDYAATEYLTLQALLNREISWRDTYFTAASGWGTTLPGQAGASNTTNVKFWNTGSSSPIEDVNYGKILIKQATGYDPNVLVVGYKVKFSLERNPELIDIVKYGQTAPGPAVVDNSALCRVFGVAKVVEMGAIQTTSAEGAPTAVTGFIGGDNALLAYAAPAPGLMTASAGYTFNWTLPGGTGAGWRIKKYRLEQYESDIVEIQQAYAHGLVAPALGVLYSAVRDTTVTA